MLKQSVCQDPGILNIGRWSGVWGFDAYTQRQFVTESSYNNRLVYHHISSTIKTLPATLPEPRTMVRWPSSKHIGPWSTELEPRAKDLGPQIRVTDPVSFFTMTYSKGLEPRLGWALRLGPSLLDWLMNWGVHNATSSLNLSIFLLIMPCKNKM